MFNNNNPQNNKKETQKAGFTIIELLVVLAIIFILAGTSLVNYNKFGKEIDLENMTYNVALTIRTAQSFGINRRDDLSTSFDEPKPYGVYFTTLFPGPPINPPVGVTSESFMVFLDNKDGTVPGSNNIFDNSGTGGACIANPADECIEILTMNQLIYISSLCAGDDAATCVERDQLYITFKRPNPDAIIKSSAVTEHSYAEITLSSPIAGITDQKIAVGVAGQISIK